MAKSAAVFFCLACVLLQSIRDTRAEELFAQNLLLSTKKPQPNQGQRSPLLSQDPGKHNAFFAQASEKARHGNLIEALNELSKLIADHPDEVDMSRPFAERAEVKSLLGLTNAALEDCDRACMCAGSSKFLHLWHRWMILERAGRFVEAQRALQAADKDVRRQLLPEPSLYASLIKQLAEKQRTALLKPNEPSGKKLLAVIKELSERETPPSVEEIRDLYDIPLEGEPNLSLGCTDCTGNKFWVDANSSADMTILHLRVNTDLCTLPKEAISNVFALEQESNGTSFAARERGKLQGLRFGFDADLVQFIGFYWKTPGLSQSAFSPRE